MPGGTGPLSALESHERPFQPHALLNNIHFYLAGTTESLQKGQIAQQRHSNGNAGIMSAVSLPRFLSRGLVTRMICVIGGPRRRQGRRAKEVGIEARIEDQISQLNLSTYVQLFEERYWL